MPGDTGYVATANNNNNNNNQNGGVRRFNGSDPNEFVFWKKWAEAWSGAKRTCVHLHLCTLTHPAESGHTTLRPNQLAPPSELSCTDMFLRADGFAGFAKAIHV